jgi:hypothetical protein
LRVKLHVVMVWQSRPPPGPSWAKPLPDVRTARPRRSVKLATPNVALRSFVMALASWLFHAAHFLPLFAIWQPAIAYLEEYAVNTKSFASTILNYLREYAVKM